MLTEAQVKMVQDSFTKVEPIADTAASIFYDRLFTVAPEVKPLFAGADMSEQGKKLMTMIDTAVRGLTHLEKIVPAVQKLGVRHIEYGVKKEHFEPVGASLLFTLEKGLGEDWNDELHAAWATTYQVLADTMIAAMEDELAKSDVSLAEEKTFIDKVKGVLGMGEKA